MTAEQATDELYTGLVKRYPAGSVRTIHDANTSTVTYEDPVSGYEFQVRITKFRAMYSHLGRVKLLAYRPDEPNPYTKSWFKLSSDGVKKCLRLLSFHRTLAVKTTAHKHDRLAAEIQADLDEAVSQLVG